MRPTPIVVTDGHGVILELNAIAESKLGRARATSWSGKPLLALVARADRDVFLACLAALRDRLAPLEDELIRFGSDPGFDASISAMPEQRERRPRDPLDPARRHRAPPRRAGAARERSAQSARCWTWPSMACSAPMRRV